MTRRALVTGITGQDGYYLAKLLLEENYQVDFTLNVQSVQPRNVTLSSLRLLSVVVPLSIALVCMIATLVAMRFVRHWLKPLSALQAATRKIEIGDYSHRVKVESRDEFESLARSYRRKPGLGRCLDDAIHTVGSLSESGLDSPLTPFRWPTA